MSTALADLDDVAAALVRGLGGVTTWQLQKLAYYGQAWALVIHGQRLFPEDVEAWRDGPAVDRLYQGSKGLRKLWEWAPGRPERLAPAASGVIDQVLRRYGPLNGDELSELTHRETPWRDARRGLADDSRSRRAISDAALVAFYGPQRLSAGDAVDHAVANAWAEGVHLSELDRRRLCDLAAGVRTGRRGRGRDGGRVPRWCVIRTLIPTPASSETGWAFATPPPSPALRAFSLPCVTSS